MNSSKIRVEYSRTAEKQLEKLPRDKQISVLRKIDQLKSDPHLGKKLKGEFADFYSLKVWPYRIIYRFLPREKLIFINVIQHRQNVYK